MAEKRKIHKKGVRMGQGGEALAAATDFSEMVVKLKDSEVKGFPAMPPGRCCIKGNFLNCVVNGKYRLNISMPEGEICPACGTSLL